MRDVASILDLKVDYDSPKPAVFEVSSARQGWIHSTYGDAAAFEVNLGLACSDGNEMLPPPMEVQPSTLLREDVIVSTRSLLEVMFYLSQGVEVPLEHQAQGLVTLTVDEAGEAFDWSEMMHDIFAVQACKKCPKHAAVAVQYRDFWFYIDERDQSSLSTFTLLIELFGIEVQAGGGGGFLYTLGI